MYEVIPRQLWIGNTRDSRSLRDLHQVGIAAIVDLAAEELPPTLSRDLIYCRFPLIDGSGNSFELLAAAVEMVASLIRRRMPTLVVCGAGMSRSPVITAAALALVRGDSPGNCLQQLLADRPHDVSPLLWDDMERVWRQLRPP